MVQVGPDGLTTLAGVTAGAAVERVMRAMVTVVRKVKFMVSVGGC